jgi:hypothetical protein
MRIAYCENESANHTPGLRLHNSRDARYSCSNLELLAIVSRE